MSVLRTTWFGVDLQLAAWERWPWLVAAAAFAALLGVAVFLRWRDLRRLAPQALHAKLAPELSFTRLGGKAALSGVGLLLLAFALLRPQIGGREIEVTEQGIDLIVAVDASRSMLARDVHPSRLERAKLELSHLIDRLAGDRIGVVVFAGDAFVQCPLTSDYGAAKLFLRAIDVDAMPAQGTAIGSALETAAQMFRSAEHGATSRVVLLLTDGEDHSGRLERVVDELREEGIRIFALGVGTEGGAPIPVVDREGRVTGYWRDAEGETVISRLHDGQLRAIAERSGGLYVRGQGTDLGMAEIRAELSRLEASERESHRRVEWGELYAAFAGPGLLFFLLGTLLPEGRRRR